MANKSPNAEIIDDISQAVAIIMSHKVFHDVVEKNPLAVGKGGVLKQYSAADYTAAMKDVGRYVCGCNAFWGQQVYSPLPDVPLREDSKCHGLDHILELLLVPLSPRGFDRWHMRRGSGGEVRGF